MNVLLSAPDYVRKIIVDKLCSDPARPVSIAYLPYPLIMLPLPPIEQRSAIVLYEDGALKCGALVRGIRRSGHDAAVVAILDLDNDQASSDLRCTVLAAGADDVQGLNIDARELLARLTTIMRRAGYRDHRRFEMPGGAIYQAAAHCFIANGGARVHLSPMQAKIFDFLILAGDGGAPVTTAAFMEHFYPDDDDEDRGTKIIAVQMHALRGKIQRATGGYDMIETLYAQGYRLVKDGFKPVFNKTRVVSRVS